MDQIGKAIVAHSRWKQHLKKAIDTGESEFSVEIVENHHLCDFGKWLDSEAGKSIKHYNEIYELHNKCHIEAARVLKLALNQQSNEAETQLEFRSDFSKISAKLVNKLGELKK
jgi:hypothetical protein